MSKLKSILAAAAGLAIAASAWATNYTPPEKMQAQPIYNTSAGAGSESNATGGHVGNISTGGASSSGGSVGNVGGGSVGDIKTSGGAGGAGGSSSIGSVAGGSGGSSAVGPVTGGNAAGGNATGGNSAGGTSDASSSAETYSATGDMSTRIDGGSSVSKYLSIGLPAPVWTSVPTPFGCLVTESSAGAAGWNFVSGSKTRQHSDVVCTTIRMAEAAYLHCQYETAAYLNKRAFETMHGGDGAFFFAGAPKNLSPVECDELKRPKLRMEPTISPPAPAVKPVACTPQPRTRKVVTTKRKKPTACVNCCQASRT